MPSTPGFRGVLQPAQSFDGDGLDAGHNPIILFSFLDPMLRDCRSGKPLTEDQ
jgi:hypothetical protein